MAPALSVDDLSVELQEFLAIAFFGDVSATGRLGQGGNGALREPDWDKAGAGVDLLAELELGSIDSPDEYAPIDKNYYLSDGTHGVVVGISYPFFRDDGRDGYLSGIAVMPAAELEERIEADHQGHVTQVVSRLSCRYGAKLDQYLIKALAEIKKKEATLG